jgi:hypothetical protein
LYIATEISNFHKKSKMRIIVISIGIFLGSLLFFSCSATKGMRVQVLRPATISVPQEIQKLGILNRAVPSSKTNAEAIVSGETPLRDKELSQECLRGLTETLNTSQRFKIAICDSAYLCPDAKSLNFGPALTWQFVDSLCSKYEVDGLLVLEFFDTDFQVVKPVSTATQAIGSLINDRNNTNANSGIRVTGSAAATAGFRVYYGKSHKIAYEDRFAHKKNWSQTAYTVQDAMSKLIKRNNALLEVSNETGYEFAMSIVPLYYWEDRVMFKGKKGMMERAQRQALTKDWDAALQSWSEIYDGSEKTKIRAKAAHNAGLACEVLGKLEDAQKWLSKSYIEKGYSETLRYSEIIDSRIREQEKLKKQLESFE